MSITKNIKIPLDSNQWRALNGMLLNAISGGSVDDIVDPLQDLCELSIGELYYDNYKKMTIWEDGNNLVLRRSQALALVVMIGTRLENEFTDRYLLNVLSTIKMEVLSHLQGLNIRPENNSNLNLLDL